MFVLWHLFPGSLRPHNTFLRLNNPKGLGMQEETPPLGPFHNDSIYCKRKDTWKRTWIIRDMLSLCSQYLNMGNLPNGRDMALSVKLLLIS